MASLVVALRIEVRIALFVVLGPVVDTLIPIIGIIDFASDPVASLISAPRIEVGIAVPVELRPIINRTLSFLRPIDQAACSVTAIIFVRGATGDGQQSNGGNCIDCDFHDSVSDWLSGNQIVKKCCQTRHNYPPSETIAGGRPAPLG
ncbi:MAG: hypothetical protein ACREIP_06465, partial [Alphaproteobacteria bacterium]